MSSLGKGIHNLQPNLADGAIKVAKHFPLQPSVLAACTNSGTNF